MKNGYTMVRRLKLTPFELRVAIEALNAKRLNREHLRMVLMCHSILEGKPKDRQFSRRSRCKCRTYGRFDACRGIDRYERCIRGEAIRGRIKRRFRRR